jgi:hypothetical protein
MTALAKAKSVDQAAYVNGDQRTRARDCSTTSMISLPPGTSDPHPRCREASMMTPVTSQQVT